MAKYDPLNPFTFPEEFDPEYSIGQFGTDVKDAARGAVGGAVKATGDLAGLAALGEDLVQAKLMGTDPSEDAAMFKLLKAYNQLATELGADIAGNTEVAQEVSKTIGENLGMPTGTAGKILADLAILAPASKVLSPAMRDKVTDMNALDYNDNMELDFKHSNEELYKATGAYRDDIDAGFDFPGRDRVILSGGKPAAIMAEIDDSAAKFSVTDVANKQGYTKLGQLLDHPELFEKFPELADVQIEVGQTLRGGGRGVFDPNTGRIALATTENGEKRTDKQILSTLLHEVQHVVQNEFGMPYGGTPSVKIMQTRKAGERTQFSIDDAIFLSDRAREQLTNSVTEVLNELPQSVHAPAASVLQMVADLPYYRNPTDIQHIRNQVSLLLQNTSNPEKFLKEMSKAVKLMRKNKNAYFDTKGEVQARTVQDRFEGVESTSQIPSDVGARDYHSKKVPKLRGNDMAQEIQDELIKLLEGSE